MFDLWAAATPRRTTGDGLQFDRTNETLKWCVSDLRRARRGAKNGAAKQGSLTPGQATSCRSSTLLVLAPIGSGSDLREGLLDR